MKRNKRIYLLSLLPGLALTALSLPVHAQRATTSFDAGWRFNKGEAKDAEQTTFNHEGWRPLDVPHDWSIEGPYDKDNPTSGSGAFLPAGVGWYRKHFKLSPADAVRRVFIEFDGIMANSDVWINGFHLGKRPYGYVSFAYELTAHLNFGVAAGTIKAVGSNGGRVVATHDLRTARAAAKIILTADRSRITNSAEDVAHITVTVVDQNGVMVPNADNLISFALTGPGVIAAVDNGDNASHELFQASERHAYQGMCLVMIKAKGSAGRIKLTATSSGLGAASIELAASPLGR